MMPQIKTTMFFNMADRNIEGKEAGLAAGATTCSTE